MPEFKQEEMILTYYHNLIRYDHIELDENIT